MSQSLRRPPVRAHAAAPENYCRHPKCRATFALIYLKGFLMKNPHSAKARSLVISGLNGNETFCLGLKGYRPGHMVVGNSVQSIGFLGGVSAGVRNLAGGESADVTRTVKAGRDAALHKMEAEAQQVSASGVTGVSSSLGNFAGNIEFLSTGSAVNSNKSESFFTTSFDGKELYCILDAGYRPTRFVFGNIAYSVGLGGGIIGGIKSMFRGEIREYSDILNATRHAALKRLIDEARSSGANAVVGVEVDMMPFAGFHEMLMTGTGAIHPLLPTGSAVASCDLTCDELWSLASQGYAPIKIVMGTAVYSLGVVGGIIAAFKGLKRGEVSDLTKLVYDAREHALDQLEEEALACGAEMVVGTDVYIHELGGGLVEFMAIGTAVKRVTGMATSSPSLPVQAAIQHRSTFRNSFDDMLAGSVCTE
jgi:uncharacterized protein YbjQ (UPF0145 family)